MTEGMSEDALQAAEYAVQRAEKGESGGVAIALLAAPMLIAEVRRLQAEQAKREEHLLRAYREHHAQCEALAAERDALRAALALFAERSHWVSEGLELDGWKGTVYDNRPPWTIARTALGTGARPMTAADVEQYDVVLATFRPQRMDNLLPGVSPWIGRRFRWEVLWEIPDGEYQGQWAMGVYERFPPEDHPPFARVPFSDLAKVEPAER